MGRFEARIRVDMAPYRNATRNGGTYRESRGDTYLGRQAMRSPVRTMTVDRLVREWARSLESEGRIVSVVGDGDYLVVSAN